MYITAHVNGQPLSEGTGLNPLTIGPLNASLNEVSAPVAVTLKADAGYATTGNATVTFVGTSAARWSVCATENGSYAPSLVISDPITETGTTIYVKAAAVEGEPPANDTSVDLQVTAVVTAA